LPPCPPLPKLKKGLEEADMRAAAARSESLRQSSRLWMLGLALLGPRLALACDFCRPRVQAGIFNEHFTGRLAITLLPLVVMLLLVALIVRTPWRRLESVPASGARRDGTPGASA
jgi:hypothetical protein